MWSLRAHPLGIGWITTTVAEAADAVAGIDSIESQLTDRSSTSPGTRRTRATPSRWKTPRSTRPATAGSRSTGGEPTEIAPLHRLDGERPPRATLDTPVVHRDQHSAARVIAALTNTLRVVGSKRSDPAGAPTTAAVQATATCQGAATGTAANPTTHPPHATPALTAPPP